MKRIPPRTSNVPAARPPRRARTPLPRKVKRARPPARTPMPPPPLTAARPKPPKRDLAHLLDDREKSLVDVLDSLLNQGVVLNADLILALADVDLVYVRLSALLCAADRVLPRTD